MAYAPEFYVPENIIGYTGVLTRSPTVYFLSATHYGHITQVHDEWRNVGRETIRPTDQYTFGNLGDNNALVEADYLAGLSHESRSPMILVGKSSIPPELTHAIMVHSEQKALRGAKKPVVTKENLARKYHAGQQPTAAERSAVPELIIFMWERGNGRGVPQSARLHALAGTGAS